MGDPPRESVEDRASSKARSATSLKRCFFVYSIAILVVSGACSASLDDIGSFPCAIDGTCPPGFNCLNSTCLKAVACAADGMCPAGLGCASGHCVVVSGGSGDSRGAASADGASSQSDGSSSSTTADSSVATCTSVGGVVHTTGACVLPCDTWNTCPEPAGFQKTCEDMGSITIGQRTFASYCSSTCRYDTDCANGWVCPYYSEYRTYGFCTLRCDKATPCPTGLACNSTQGWCVRRCSTCKKQRFCSDCSVKYCGECMYSCTSTCGDVN